jgi:uncharacterized membrane protein
MRSNLQSFMWSLLGRRHARRGGFLRDIRASVAPALTLGMISMVGLSFVAMDAADGHRIRQDAQSAADAAALAAARNLSSAEVTGRSVAAANGFPEASIAVGAFNDATGFAATATGGRAVKVTIETRKVSFAGHLLGRAIEMPVGASAVALTRPQAAFAIGTAIARVEGGAINALLSGWLGAGISISAVDYEGLLTARVDLGRFLGAVAIRSGQPGASFAQLLGQDLRIGDILAALGDSLPAGGFATSLRTGFGVAPGARMSLAALLDPGVHANGLATAGLGTAVSMGGLDLVRMLATIGISGRTIASDIALGIPGVASASVRLRVGEGIRHSPMIALGDAGLTIRSAQVRLQVTLRVALPALPGVEVRVPVYIEAGEGIARLAEVNCGTAFGNDAVLGVSPGLAQVHLGEVSLGEIERERPVVAPARLVTLPLAALTGRARIAIENRSETMLRFTEADVARGTPKSTSVTTITGSLFSSLIRDSVLEVETLGISLISTGGLSSALVRSGLENLFQTIDPLLANLLATLGVRVGVADTWVHAIQCSTPRLVR